MKALFALVLVAVAMPAHADVKAGERKAQLCLLCHKPDNQASIVPLLEGQTRQYLLNPR